MNDPLFIGSMAVAGISVLCALGVAVGIVIFFLRRSRQASALDKASAAWPATTGTVITSRVEVSSGEPITVTPHVAYRYDVGGVTYQGDRIRAGDAFMKTGGSSHAYQTIDRYPEGASVTVYYNPDNPAESALER